MIAVVDYRMGNLLSVERGLKAVGADAHIIADAGEIARAEAIVLPGVGAFGDAVESMRTLGQMDVIAQRIKEGVPFLGICLGLHLLCEAGTEGATVATDVPTESTTAVATGTPNTTTTEGATGSGSVSIPGMGFISATADKMPAEDAKGAFYKIPHVGWNTIEPPQGSDFTSPLFAGINPGEYFYFTHSYCVPVCAATTAVTEHSITFTSAAQIGERAFAVQFHPEKSSDAGAAVLRNFVQLAQKR